MNTLNILKILKAELKKAKITYRDVAKELKMTEAGVKKIFARRDISLERILAICKVLNIPLSEIVQMGETSQQGDLRFSEKQIEFLKKNIHYFHFYMKLAYEQKTPAQIQSEFNLSLKCLSSYLKKLEDLDLIKRHPKDRAQIVGGIPMSVSTGGTDLESVKFDITHDLLESIRSAKDGSLFGASLFLTSDQTQDLRKKLADLMSTYSAVSTTNRRNSKAKATSTSAMILMSPTSMFNRVWEF